MVSVKTEIKKNRSIIKNNRFLLLILFFFGMLGLLVVISDWTNITPAEVIDPLTANVQYGNVTTVYVQETHNIVLSSRYESDSKEYLYCLYGQLQFENEDEKPAYAITRMEETEVTASNYDSLTFKPCTRYRDYLGTIHSHPQPDNPRQYATCGLSSQDLFTFGKDDSLIIGVICGEDKIAFYGSDSFDESYQVKIIEDLK